MTNKIILIFSSIFVFGCTTVRRDIYFKDIDSQYKNKSISAVFPGNVFWSDFIKKNDRKVGRVRMEILNFATGNYTFGVVIPFFPVFYLSENQFELESKNFNIGCRVENFVDFKKEVILMLLIAMEIHL